MHEPAWLAEEIAQCDDPNSIVTALALAGQCALCEKTMDMFVSAYGAAAGDLALMATATGGLYIGGGIAPRILEKLKDGRFMDAFLDKGRLRWLLEAVPVRIILDSTTALQGAAAYAEALIAQILRR
jgi:glucokinase